MFLTIMKCDGQILDLLKYIYIYMLHDVYVVICVTDDHVHVCCY